MAGAGLGARRACAPPAEGPRRPRAASAGQTVLTHAVCGPTLRHRELKTSQQSVDHSNDTRRWLWLSCAPCAGSVTFAVLVSTRTVHNAQHITERNTRSVMLNLAAGDDAGESKGTAMIQQTLCTPRSWRSQATVRHVCTRRRKGSTVTEGCHEGLSYYVHQHAFESLLECCVTVV